MHNSQEIVLVSAPNLVGEQFVKSLQLKRVPYAAIVNNNQEYDRMRSLGVENIITVNTIDDDTWVMPDIRIGRVYLFEKSMNLCCRYILICRKWTVKPIYVVTESIKPKLMYRGLGANYVLYTSGQDTSFLITDDMEENSIQKEEA
ncbi:hypothetical protein RB620_20035 [Paenibacillus sp. LHD-117]|uniref:hypothetical protein n=1 Tax=Paenibacillus sp. LHD-117 TaxID=3071412 RepID=UPI0027DF14A3|nr:hypothetical protein [Paenibacillus sp. LHD-117]MDQ6421720.1 hypothetical protein [Paenibacillus sp. LHD-117]